jgi:hypothetical protein
MMRKEMATDNEVIRYIRYAVGEIVLIVIGILIALSINNWNEQRIIQKDVRLSLSQIFNDLQQEERQLQENVVLFQNCIEYLTAVSAGNYAAVHLDSLVAYLDRYFAFFKTNNAYAGLKETGKFSNINNPELKAAITSYYEIDYEILIADTKYGEAYTNNHVVPFVIAHLEPDRNNMTHGDVVLRKLRTTSLKSLINYQIVVMRFVLKHLESSIQNNSRLISQIEAELNSSQ